MKYTPTLIANCLQENLEEKTQPVTNYEYLTRKANVTIDEDAGAAME